MGTGPMGSIGSSDGASIVTRTLFYGHTSSDARWKSSLAKKMALWPSFGLRRRAENATRDVLELGEGDGPLVLAMALPSMAWRSVTT